MELLVSPAWARPDYGDDWKSEPASGSRVPGCFLLCWAGGRLRAGVWWDKESGPRWYALPCRPRASPWPLTWGLSLLSGELGDFQAAFL